MDRRIHAMLLTLVAIAGLILLGWSSRTHAAGSMADYTVNIGSVYAMSLSVCSKQASAVAVLEAEKISHDHASKLFDALDDCDNIAAAFRVGPIVASFTTGRALFQIVEIQVPHNPRQKAYWLTSMKIAPAPIGEKPSDAIRQPQLYKPS